MGHGQMSYAPTKNRPLSVHMHTSRRFSQIIEYSTYFNHQNQLFERGRFIQEISDRRKSIENVKQVGAGTVSFH